jgi:hypothetical protein
VRLAPALDTEQFGEAERGAVAVEAQHAPLGLTVVPADVPVDAVVRAASLTAAVARHDLVVDLGSAAWVHGAVADLPRPLTLAVDRSHARRTRTVFPPPREALLRRDDVERLGGVLVTTPLKTAFDLLRLDDAGDPRTAEVAGALLAVARLSPGVAAALAQLQPGCPHKQRGIDRLAALR